jgi:hypothetical protein
MLQRTSNVNVKRHEAQNPQEYVKNQTLRITSRNITMDSCGQASGIDLQGFSLI